MDPTIVYFSSCGGLARASAAIPRTVIMHFVREPATTGPRVRAGNVRANDEQMAGCGHALRRRENGNKSKQNRTGVSLRARRETPERLNCAFTIAKELVRT